MFLSLSNRMENISKHVSYKEGVRSNTALRLGIENVPRR
jgi:hypothetical protein